MRGMRKKGPGEALKRNRHLNSIFKVKYKFVKGEKIFPSRRTSMKI